MHLEKYRYVREYDTTTSIPRAEIYNILKKTWQVTPSKNNFMPYSVFVLGPDQQELKNKVYGLCIKNESKANNIPDIEKIRDYENNKPQFWNIVTCNYLLIFTPRVEDKPNPWQLKQIENGNVFDQMNAHRMDKTHTNTSIEIGMFANTFASLCLEKDIDISHTMCFSSDIDDWHSIGLTGIEYYPLLLMSVGKGMKYRQPAEDPIEQLDLKPDFTRIVNFVR